MVSSPSPYPAKRTRGVSKAPVSGTNPKPPRWFLIIFGLLFGGMPLVFMLPLALAPVGEFFKASVWETTPCVITRSAVVEQKNDNGFRAEVAYEYSFRDKKFTGQRVGVRSKEQAGSHAEMKVVVDRYPQGKRTTCLVNPAMPEEALLERDFPWYAVGHCAFLLPFIGVGSAFFLWGLGMFSRKKKPVSSAGSEAVADNPFVQQTETAPVSSVKRRFPGWVFFVLFGLVFAGAGSVALFFGGRSYWRVSQSDTWVETPCVIQRSEVKTSRSSDSTTYSVYVRYAYVWNGEQFIGERYDFSTGSDSDYSSKRAAVKQNPKGKKTVCFVNPAVPSESVLVREAGTLAWLPLVIGGVFVLVGSGIVVSGLVGGRKRPLDDSIAQTHAPLPVKTTPLRTFFGLLFFSVFWNGIVSVFVVVQIKDYLRDGTVDWFFVCFISVFVVAGIAVIGGTIWTGLSVLGARLTVAMKPVVYPGESVPLTWQVSGAPHRITSLKMCLECIEEHTTEGGKNRHRHENTLDKIEFLEVTGPLATHAGEVVLEVPLDVQVSSDPHEGAGGIEFSSNEGKVSWQITAEVRRRRRPKQTWKYRVIVREVRTKN